MSGNERGNERGDERGREPGAPAGPEDGDVPGPDAGCPTDPHPTPAGDGASTLAEDDASAPAGDDALTPAEDDAPTWTVEDDDRTPETLRWLRDKRRAHRRRKSRDLAVVVYTLLLVVVGYGSGYAFHFMRRVELGADYSGLGADLQRALPALCTLITAALALAAARDALWRGPVVVPAPSVGWLLAQPVRREKVLRPWFRLSAGLAVVPGLLVAAGGAVALRVTGLASLGSALLALLPATLCLPLLAVSVGMAVERRAVLAARVRRFTPLAVLVLMLLAAQVVLAVRGHRSVLLERAELWSGPWGWAAQPVIAATGGAAPGWWIALAALVLLTAAGLLLGHRDAARVPTAQLRRRAATAQTVSSVMWTVELRAARLALLDATGSGRVHRARLPAPRSKYLVAVWRDALALLRSPGRLAKALMWTVCATAAAALGTELDGGRRDLCTVVALLLGYVAVGALAEPARLETDDVRRAAWSPFRLRTLMLQHTVVPAVTGALLALVAAVPFAVAGAPWALLLWPLCALPFAAAAVFAACRGPARTSLMFTGVSTPVGDPGVLIFLAWYAAGPLVTVGGLALALGAVPHRPDAAGVGGVAVVAALLTAGLLYFAARSANRLVRH
ncbi:DUF6297 family protein [Streptomyces eurocidicus]|uniref:Uncharacterized protein n=1 Tax=Streptomyces eurocidicus TaxID=66423 RepID=A0A7W8B5T6_STREU|nr:DUF6297 family protein [Streptomyces eurocidicus]MBB5117352.1 hypothetical protein [Streptomyces eurocidicus]